LILSLLLDESFMSDKSAGKVRIKVFDRRIMFFVIFYLFQSLKTIFKHTKKTPLWGIKEKKFYFISTNSLKRDIFKNRIFDFRFFLKSYIIRAQRASFKFIIPAFFKFGYQENALPEKKNLKNF